MNASDPGISVAIVNLPAGHVPHFVDNLYHVIPGYNPGITAPAATFVVISGEITDCGTIVSVHEILH